MSNNGKTNNESLETRALVRLAREIINDDVRLHRIVKLDLSGGGLSTLPETMPTDLANLSILFLSNNNFVEMPALIGKCPNLQMVAFKSNGMRSIHPEALQSQLRWLILTDNQLTTLPDTIGRCTSLQKCMLAGNQLRELPDESIQHLHQLELIRLACNQLVAPPLTLLQLPALKWVALGDNPFLHSTAARLSPAQSDTAIPILSDLKPEAVAAGRVLGAGAGGTTVAVDYRGQTVAVKVYQTTTTTTTTTTTPVGAGASTNPKLSMTSDGLPDSERAVAMTVSCLQCPALIRILGVCATTQSLVMEYLDQYQTLAQPPSFETCSRDVYPAVARRTKDDGDDNEDETETATAGITLSWSEASNAVSVLLDAMVQLHRIGIAHGDFYGHNILIQTTDLQQVRLSDFGAAFAYDTQAEYGRLVQTVELRALAVLVEEVATFLFLPDATNADTSQSQQQLLNELAARCQQPNTTFDQVHIWWQQQRLAEMVTAFGVEDEN